MFLSCLLPTYNRAPNYLHLLNEAVESFLRQEETPGVKRELLILNDTPGQIIHCHAPGIFVFNTVRFPSLGEKRNQLVNYAIGDVLVVWDDDDISLPERLRQVVDYISRGYDYFNPQASWFMDSGGLHSDHKHGYCHNASAFTRRAWEAVGGYPPTSGNEDAVMDKKLRERFGTNPPLLEKKDWHYIYRWNVSPRHLSGKAGGLQEDPHKPHYDEIGREPIHEGVFTLEPRWRVDYATWTTSP